MFPAILKKEQAVVNATKKQLLIIDDKIAIARIITVYLSDEYEITYFDSPLKAMQWLFEGNRPDLIVLDIWMPGMSGDEFLSFIKQNGLYKDIPVLILSGEESSDFRIKMLEEGAADFILKPFNPQELKVRIRKVLQ
ncbi:response regulator [Lascolabacillus sp.]|jgi:DNA-binding response OmpR family regulator|uniref:response regulator transcription factor n=1 Tax=Lascolabacillus sp. TaxID=1924068 RepID=UPI0008E0E98D|nr:response regulator [Lascolabacillus sp.]MDD2607341.1 response regulator [Lascolabacillus sp.]MDD3869898.1 response regulator [Candidatus Cloacimonadota bacterium]SFU35198.1 Response regulator receiver domain-containing protein [Porphyromonadaceae bacterium KHP3R9]